MEYHPGDLLLVKPGTHVPPGTRYSSGILLDEPQFPRYGNYPKNYRILTPQGTVEIISDQHKYLIEVV
jgi:hypothetical protein